jgi:hypothetical protein
MEASTVVLAVIGIAIVVVGVLLLMEVQKKPAEPTERVIVREDVRRWWPRRWGWGPYYSHLPVRPVLY